jgi:DNA (cytosine-5)-methyltransferase 1
VSGQRSGEHHAYPTETSGCLQHKGLAASGNEAGTLVHAVAFTSKDHGQDAGNISPTLRAMQGQHPNAGGQVAIAFQERGRTGGRQTEWQDDVAYSLNAPSGGGRRQEMNIATRSAVRRLTPLEAERLQGLPDRYTDVPFRGKRAADGPRYRAIGNSIAVPVIRWIGERIAKVDAIKPQP